MVLSASQKLDVISLVDKLNIEMRTKAVLPFCTNECPYVKNKEGMTICIKTNGNIQPCPMLNDIKYSLGDIFNFNLCDFELNTNNFVELARKRTRQNYGCSECFLQKTCGKGCLAEVINLCGDPLGNDEGCEFRKMYFLEHEVETFFEV